ncbi:MAG: SAM-dependent methyltransferase [Treponemataceae bacterium]
MKIGFLAYQDMLKFLVSELEERFCIDVSKGIFYGMLLYFEDIPESVFEFQNFPYWARTTLLNPKIEKIETIGDVVRLLKSIQRNWAPYQFTQFRRSSLIHDKMPYINLKDKVFPFRIPQSNIGLYSLIDEKTLLYSDVTSSFLPAGSLKFVEDHENPPSRAYLKLQEALSRFVSYYDVEFPDEKCTCFDAGACPGGWTWVLRQLGSKVFAVDRAELDQSLMSDQKVVFKKHDAFTLKPEQVGFFDWVFSDVICYPERLYEWVNIWIGSGMTTNMICTIKMQGKTDWNMISRFAEIPCSRIEHLCYNKHELTWMWHKS